MRVLIIKHSLGGGIGGPAEDIEFFWKSRQIEFLVVVSHPLNRNSAMETEIRIYRHGSLVESRRYRRFLVPPLGHLLDVRYLKFQRDFGFNFDIVVGFNPWASFLSRTFTKHHKIAHWGVDFTPSRSSNRLFSWIATKAEFFLLRKVDILIENNEYVLAERLRHLDAQKNVKSYVVPIGHDHGKAEKQTSNDKLTLLYLGSLNERNGANKLLDIFLHILEKNPNSQLNIVGNGDLLNHLVQEVQRLSLDKSVVIYGEVTDPIQLDLIMKSSHFGLAPYDPSFDTHTKYADPGKLVKYVSYGIIPVVSEVPLIAHDYEAKGAAILIRFSEHPEFWAKKIIDCFLDDVTFSKLQESALKLGDSRQNIEIFQNLDQFLINQIKK